MREVSKVAETIERKPFKSIHIDTEKGIYLLNGEEVPRVSRIDLELIMENGRFLSREMSYMCRKRPRKIGINDCVIRIGKRKQGGE